MNKRQDPQWIKDRVSANAVFYDALSRISGIAIVGVLLVAGGVKLVLAHHSLEPAFYVLGALYLIAMLYLILRAFRRWRALCRETELAYVERRQQQRRLMDQ